MSLTAVIGYLLAAWAIGFLLGQVHKFFRRLVEMA